MPMAHLEKARLSLTGKEAAGARASARGNYVGSSHQNSLGQTSFSISSLQKLPGFPLPEPGKLPVYLTALLWHAASDVS